MRILRILFAIVICLLFGLAYAQTRYLSQPKGDAWLDLVTGKIHMAADEVKPSGPLIWGEMDGKYFRPSRIVEFAAGAAEPNPNDQPGWIELQTGLIYSDITGRAPQFPFLRGRITSKGLFMVYPDELKKWSLSGQVNGSSARKGQPAGSPAPSEKWTGESTFAVLRSVEGELIEVRLQPTEIVIDRAVKWQRSDTAGSSLSFVFGEPGILQMEVNLRSATDVYRDYIRNLERLTQEGENQRPPKCLFSWGRNFPSFQGVIESLNVKYTAFAPDGTPLKATVNLRLKEADRLLNRREASQSNR